MADRLSARILAPLNLGWGETELTPTPVVRMLTLPSPPRLPPLNGICSMDAVYAVPPQIWLIIHLIGIVLAVSSRSHLGPMCALCTSCLLTASTAVVGVVAAVGFVSQQPFWAASGCTLGIMAIVICFERAVHEPDRLLQAFASGEEPAAR